MRLLLLMVAMSLEHFRDDSDAVPVTASDQFKAPLDAAYFTIKDALGSNESSLRVAPKSTESKAIHHISHVDDQSKLKATHFFWESSV